MEWAEHPRRPLRCRVELDTGKMADVPEHAVPNFPDQISFGMLDPDDGADRN